MSANSVPAKAIEALRLKADEVQREMTRYCAGIDQWDAMPVVVEGWLRVFEELQALLTAPLPETMTERQAALLDSQFRAGVTAGWNAAQADTSEEANARLAQLIRVNPGDMAAFKQPLPETAQETERVYPCDDCGKLMTKAEGGSVFTVCEACWDKSRASSPQETAHWQFTRADYEREAILCEGNAAAHLEYKRDWLATEYERTARMLREAAKHAPQETAQIPAAREE